MSLLLILNTAVYSRQYGYIEIVNSQDSVLDVRRSMTMMFWFKPHSLSGWMPLLYDGHQNPDHDAKTFGSHIQFESPGRIFVSIYVYLLTVNFNLPTFNSSLQEFFS